MNIETTEIDSEHIDYSETPIISAMMLLETAADHDDIDTVKTLVWGAHYLIQFAQNGTKPDNYNEVLNEAVQIATGRGTH
jgi:hypothetical protein